MRAGIDMDSFRCFVTAVETGIFTRAGERLWIGQSAMEQQIPRLEQRLLLTVEADPQ
jgi:DNA-binding transcriptional LysR family regulator